VPDYDLLHNTRHIAELPQGALMVIDTTVHHGGRTCRVLIVSPP
jgi:hypothetical protein